ncbi:MAG: DUF294 nucleotidyltransferase-like domain-containing protein [Saprospiraceae bacterium]
MDNAIPTRIFGFIKNYPPFSLIPEKELSDLAKLVLISYLKKDEFVFQGGEELIPGIHIVRDGAVNLYNDSFTPQLLVDQCDEGDVFGIHPLITNAGYLLTARAAEESLLYTVRKEHLEPLLESFPDAKRYLTQNLGAGMRKQIESVRKLEAHKTAPKPGTTPPLLIDIQSIEHSKKPVSCSPETTIREAAILMRETQVGSIIVVNESMHPVGILTDRDLRNKVVTGDYPLDVPVSKLMSSPVVTLPPEQTVADVQMAMMKHGIHHICITETGQPGSRLLGILSEHDVLVIQGTNPAILIREFKRSRDKESLKQIRDKAEHLLLKYLEQELAIGFICKMITEINDVLIQRAIEISQKALEEEGRPAPDVNWCWLSLGSGGRGEQLLKTDQDNALVYAPVPQSEEAEVKAYFLDLAKRTTEILDYCGFEFCPADMMASNPSWCLSLDGWKDQFSKWIVTPTEQNVMFCTIFFDFRPVYGDFSLSESLAEHIIKTAEKESRFLTFLAKDALHNPPPVTFFRNFVVEKSGEHKDEFDIKLRAMMPLADAARVLILHAQQPGINNSFQRLDKMAELEPNNRELFEQAADAYEILLRYRAIEGLRNKDSGRYISPEHLTKMERLNLRNSFTPIDDLQDLIKVRFRVNLLM